MMDYDFSFSRHCELCEENLANLALKKYLNAKNAKDLRKEREEKPLVYLCG